MKERLAFGLARKLTIQPHLVDEADLAPLRKHYSDQELLQMIASIGGFNAMTRWTDGLAIPQEKRRSFLTEASPKYKDRPSQVALLTDSTGELPSLVRRRPASPEEIAKGVAEGRSRTTWVQLAPIEDARKLLPEDQAKGAVPNWVRLLAVTRGGEGRVAGQYALRDKGNLEPKLRAQIDWIAAHHDRAWYALARAGARLRELGTSEQDIAPLAGAWEGFSDKERAVFRLVRVSTVSPMAVTDDLFNEVLKHCSDRQAAEIVHRVCEAAFFNRLTETARLPIDQ